MIAKKYDVHYRTEEVTYIYVTYWIQGGISYTNGTNMEASNRCRYGSYLTFNDTVTLEVATGYKFAVREYSSNSSSAYVGTPVDFTSDRTTLTPTSGHYYRIVIGKTDDSDFTPSDVGGTDIKYYYAPSSGAYDKYTLLGQSDADEIDLFYMECGEMMITPSAANTVTSGTLTFTNEFESAPNVVITARTTVPANVTCGVSDITATGFKIYMTRTNTTNTYFQWLAIGKKKA